MGLDIELFEKSYKFLFIPLSNVFSIEKSINDIKLLSKSRVFNQFFELIKVIDFFQAKQLNSLRTGVKRKIKSVEAKIMPNIIA